MPPANKGQSNIELHKVGVPGSTVVPKYGQRNMKCYLVTESELHSLSLANGLMAACLSIMSFFIAFAIDISKDVAFSGVGTEAAKIFSGLIRPLCISTAVIFLIGAGASFWWRRSMISMIKQETTSER